MSNGVIMIKDGDRVRLWQNGTRPIPLYLHDTWATVKRFSGHSSVIVETTIGRNGESVERDRKIGLDQILDVDRGSGVERVPWQR